MHRERENVSIHVSIHIFHALKRREINHCNFPLQILKAVSNIDYMTFKKLYHVNKQ